MDNLRRFEGKKVLVTGGAGFVGSNLVAALLEDGADVVVLDDLFTGSLDNLSPHERLEFVEGSVTDRKLVDKVVRPADIIFHLAARNIIASTKNPVDDFKVNIGGTLNLLMSIREYPVLRMVNVSSCSVYGNPRYLPINEDDTFNLLSPYAVSKLAAENYCSAFYEMYDAPISIVRYSNVYGPRQDPANPYCGVVAKFIQAVARGNAPTIHGDGSQTRDFTYVGDAVEATMLAALMKRAEGEAFNIGTGIETSVKTLARLVIDGFGCGLQPISIDRRDIDNIRRRVLNIEKIRKRLRWIPKVNISEGIISTIEWYREKYGPA